MKDRFQYMINREKDLENGILPFVEPNSIEEEIAFSELRYIKEQIAIMIKYLKEE